MVTFLFLPYIVYLTHFKYPISSHATYYESHSCGIILIRKVSLAVLPSLTHVFKKENNLTRIMTVFPLQLFTSVPSSSGQNMNQPVPLNLTVKWKTFAFLANCSEEAVFSLFFFLLLFSCFHRWRKSAVGINLPFSEHFIHKYYNRFSNFLLN